MKKIVLWAIALVVVAANISIPLSVLIGWVS